MGIFLLALALRLLALQSLAKTGYFTFLMVDEQIYHAWATELANGTYSPTSVYKFAPLPAYVMALIYKLLSPDVFYVRLLNVLLGSATCVVIYLLGKAMADRLTGLVAGLAAGLYKPFIFYSIVPLNTALSLFLFALVMYLFVAFIQKPSFLRAVILGLVSGCMLTVRENTIAMIPVLFVLILWSGFRDGFSLRRTGIQLTLILLGITLSTAPFFIRNYEISGEVALTTHQAGFNLYLGNNLDNPTPYYRPVPFALARPFVQETQFRIEASRRAGDMLSPREAEAYWIGEIWNAVMSRPAAFFWKLGQKALALLNRFEAGDNYNIEFISQFMRFFRLPFLGLAAILPLGLAGVAMTAASSRAVLGVSILGMAYASTLIVFFTNDRYRLPLLVLLIPLAVMGMRGVLTNLRQRKFTRIGIYLGISLLIVVIEHLPLQGTDDVTVAYTIHGRMLYERGLVEDAITYWERASAMNKPFSGPANLALANEHLSKREFQQARSYLEKIPDQSFTAARKYELIGDSFSLQGQTAHAITAYERSLSTNSGQLEVRRKLSNLLVSIDRERSMRESKTIEYISSFYTGL